MTKGYQQRFSLSILLWMRQDKARQVGMDYWSGGHAQIITASPGLLEYRQQHLSETDIVFGRKRQAWKQLFQKTVGLMALRK